MRKKNTVLTITFAFIAVNQDTELWTIKLRPSESVFLHQLPLLNHQRKPRLPLKLPLFHNNKEKFKLCIQSFAKAITFFIFVLVLAPANSVEVSNKDFVSRCTVKFNELFDDPIILFDTGVINKAFMDKKYAQKQRIPSIFLIRFIPLQSFDGNFIGSGLVTHFAYLFFAPLNHKPQLTRFFLTDIFQFPIFIGLPWMRSKFTTIRFKPYISTINFEQLDEMNEPVTTPEIMETNSLTEISNSRQLSSPLLAKSGNYRPLSVEKIPDEREFEEIPIFKNRKLPGQRNQERKRTRILKKGEKFSALPDEELVKKLPDEELIKKEFPEFFEVPFEIKIVTAAPFFHVFKQKRMELFSASLKDVEKTLEPKQHTDPATKLPPELYELFELFFHQEANKLFPYRFYDHKIKFMEGKQPGYGFLYSMSQGEFQILKKFFDENLTKVSRFEFRIQPSH